MKNDLSKSPLGDHLLPWIGKSVKMVQAYMVQALKNEGWDLTHNQVLILKILFHFGPHRQQDMALITQRDKTSLTRLVSSMEKKGLIKRQPCPEDKRVNFLHLTEEGTSTFLKVNPILKRCMEEIEQGISDTEKAAVVSAMKKIQANCAGI